MAEVLFTAQAIYKNGQYVFNDPNPVIGINSPKIDAFSPRNVWLLRYLIPGTNQVQYALTFTPTSDQLADVNTIQGVYFEQDGKGVMIDCISTANFITVANGTGVIQGRYGAAPAFTSPTAAWWCITRADAGTGAAHDEAVMDYVGQYKGDMRLKSNTSGVSVYLVQSYSTIIPVGSDSVAQC
jgi:hypothetical protein